MIRQLFLGLEMKIATPRRVWPELHTRSVVTKKWATTSDFV
jgi:hypothetical protein